MSGDDHGNGMDRPGCGTSMARMNLYPLPFCGLLAQCTSPRKSDPIRLSADLG